MLLYIAFIQKPLTEVSLPEEECPTCAKKGGLIITLYMRYASSIIPFFGMGRTTGVHCKHCDHVLKCPGVFYVKKKYTATIADAIKNIRKNHKRTAWQLIYPWTTCWIILGLVGYGLINLAIRQKTIANNKELLEHPQAGDMYKFDISMSGKSDAKWEKNITLFKVQSISGDTLVMVRNKENALNFGFQESDWKNLSRDNAAFNSKTYKISSQKLTDTTSEGGILEYYDKTTLDSIAKNDVNNKAKGKIIGRLCTNRAELNIVERP